jgi:hypothetical protein
MKACGQTRESLRPDAVAEQVAPLTLGEATWPWLQGFCGLLMLFFYKEILRLMVWARAMNW